jgi:hypothetical protein
MQILDSYISLRLLLKEILSELNFTSIMGKLKSNNFSYIFNLHKLVREKYNLKGGLDDIIEYIYEIQLKNNEAELEIIQKKILNLFKGIVTKNNSKDKFMFGYIKELRKLVASYNNNTFLTQYDTWINKQTETTKKTQIQIVYN